MKAAVDTEYTDVEFLDKVREDLREFKARYTDGDLLWAFVDAAGIKAPYNAEILSCDVKGFPSGTDFGNVTSFQVYIIAKGSEEFYEVRFFCDIDLTVDTRILTNAPKGGRMYSCLVYGSPRAIY